MKNYWTPMFILLIGVACAICFLPSNLPPYGGAASSAGPLRQAAVALLAPICLAFKQALWLLDKIVAG